MTRMVSRRRILTITAAAVGSVLVGGRSSPRAETELAWHGTAMGADAAILFSGVEAEAARAAVAVVTAEIERLEGAISLFREGSEICRLNRDGILDAPSSDMRRAVALALDVAAASGGLFDPTVQALWEAHADWFSARPESGLPPDAILADARRRVGWRRVSLSADVIRLGDGQRVTLNGLGQGYVTDRVADLLRAQGFAHVFIDLGEQRALGPRTNGRPWLVARHAGDPIALAGGALATSEARGCVLGAAGAAHHLFDPRTGRSASHWRGITVHHNSAAVADALSTALYATSLDEIDAVLAAFTGAIVWATDERGLEYRFGGE